MKSSPASERSNGNFHGAQARERDRKKRTAKEYLLRSFDERAKGMTEAEGTFSGDRDSLRGGRQGQRYGRDSQLFVVAITLEPLAVSFDKVPALVLKNMLAPLAPRNTCLYSINAVSRSDKTPGNTVRRWGSW